MYVSHRVKGEKKRHLGKYNRKFNFKRCTYSPGPVRFIEATEGK
jgi:hypothetical protein